MSKTSKFKKMLGLGVSGSDVPAVSAADIPKSVLTKMVQDMGMKYEIVPSALFQLYVARVGQIDLVHPVRTDKRKMFAEALAEALAEARVALEVYADQVKDEFQVETVQVDGDENNGGDQK